MKFAETVAISYIIIIQPSVSSVVKLFTVALFVARLARDQRDEVHNIYSNDIGKGGGGEENYFVFNFNCACNTNVAIFAGHQHMLYLCAVSKCFAANGANIPSLNTLKTHATVDGKGIWTHDSRKRRTNDRWADTHDDRPFFLARTTVVKRRNNTV